MAVGSQALAGCGGGAAGAPDEAAPDPEGPAPDAGEGEGEGAVDPGLPGPPEDLEITPPAPPAPPDLGAPDCPPGWTPEADADPALGPGPCVAPPDVQCSGAMAQFASSVACEPVGTPCPAEGRFPSAETIRGFVPGGEEAPVVYVDPRAPSQGDGGRDSPYRDVQDAVVRAEARGGGIVALAPGRYRGGAIPLRTASLVGACAAETILAPAGGRTVAVHATASKPLTVANLSIFGEHNAVAATGGQATVDVRSVVVEGSVGVAIGYNLGAPGGTLEEVVLRRITVAANLAAGVVSSDGASVTVRRAQVQEVEGPGLAAMPFEGDVRSSLTVENVRLNGPPGSVGHPLSMGVFCQQRCDVVAREVVVSGPWRAGVRVHTLLSEGEPHLELDVAQVGPVSASDGGGEGVMALRTAGSIRRLGLRGLNGGGLVLWAPPGGEMVAEDVRIEDVRPFGEIVGAGVSAEAGRIALRRVGVRRVEGLGLQLFGPELDLEGEDWVVENVDAVIRSRGARPIAGDGIRVLDGAQVRVERLRVDAANSEGVLVAGEPRFPVANLDMADVEVVHTAPARGSFLASAITAYDGGSLSMRRVAATDNQGVGFACLNQKDGELPTVRGDDVYMARNAATRNVEVGAGMLVEGGCSYAGARVEIADNDLAGLWTSGGAYLDPPSVTMEDLVIRGTRSTPTDKRLG